MIRDAVLSDCGRYRYLLERRLQGELAPVPRQARCLFVMLNPSVADAAQDDPTIRRCCGFASSWGYTSLAVVNLFAYRATDPGVLRRVEDPVGPGNDEWILQQAHRADCVVAAWGTNGDLHDRAASVIPNLRSAAGTLYCLGTTRLGQPRHPLYVPGAAVPELLP